MNAATPPANVSLVVNLLRRAVDPACSPGEAENAAGKLVVVARRERVGFDLLAGHIADQLPTRRPAPVPPPRPAYTPSPFDPGRVRLRVGKYAGRVLVELVAEDCSYLRWVAAEWRDPVVRRAAAAVLARAEGEGNDL